MSTPPDVLWVLDNGETDGKTFERLCVDLLGRNGYVKIIPFGGTRDHARDAELTVYQGQSDAGSLTFFQFSLEETWERKLKNEVDKILKCSHTIDELVFVSSRSITGEKRDKLRAELKKQPGWRLRIYEREWLRFQLEERHPDLAKKHLGVAVPQTIHHVEMMISASGLRDDDSGELFRNISPTELKAGLLKKIKDDVADSKTLRALADVEFHLRDYEGALKAVNEALRLATDDVERLNLRLCKGGILAEHGIKKGSRPLLIQAKEIFEWAAQKVGRANDHYNLANVLGPLSDLDGAERHYRLCLEKQPGFAQGWKNLGSLLSQKGEHEEEMKCFERALQLKPDLVEAYLCMGATYLRVLKKPQDAIRCFAKAYEIAPNLDEKWSHVRFWLSEALFQIGKLEEALKLVETSLLNKPDEVHLLGQKAKLLRKLWRRDATYEDKALNYFKFRAAALPHDHWTVIELIDLFAKRGVPDEAWQYLDLNFDCAPYLASQYGKRANLTLQDFKEGFRHDVLYMHYRSVIRLEDHFITFQNQGLFPDRRILPILDLLLMIPFGYTFEQMRATKGESNVLKAFGITWKYMQQIFPIFSANWLGQQKPTEKSDQISMVSLAMILLPEIALAEASRHIGFIGGSFGEKLDTSVLTTEGNLKAVYADVGIPWMERALIDWNLAPESWHKSGDSSDANAAS
jgi:tetratricopeptide (TPR) repeat protein